MLDKKQKQINCLPTDPELLPYRLNNQQTFNISLTQVLSVFLQSFADVLLCLHLYEGSTHRPPESVHSEVDPVHAITDPTIYGEEKRLSDSIILESGNIKVNDLSQLCNFTVSQRRAQTFIRRTGFEKMLPVIRLYLLE